MCVATTMIGGFFRSGWDANHAATALNISTSACRAGLRAWTTSKQHVGRLRRLSRGPDLVGPRPLVAVADRVLQHQLRRHVRRLELVARDLVGGRQHVGPRPLLAEQGVDHARLAGLDLAHQRHRHLPHLVGASPSALSGFGRLARRPPPPAAGSAWRRPTAGRCSARSGTSPGAAGRPCRTTAADSPAASATASSGRAAWRRSAGRC